MSKLLLCVFVAVGMFVGCKKKEAAAPKPAAPPPPAASAPLAKSPQEAVKLFNAGLLAGEMTGAKRPSSMEELEKNGALRLLPPLPPGRKYVLNPKSRELEIR